MPSGRQWCRRARAAKVGREMHPWTGPPFSSRLRIGPPDIPVLMITAHNDRSMVLECIRRGACEYLLKPFERARLHEAVHRALESRRPAALS